VTKPLADFYRAAGMRDGHRNECKVCHRAQKRQRYDSAEAVARVQEWRRRNPERFKEWQRANNARPERKRKQRDLYYRRTFGVSAARFDEILASQGGGCAICGVTPDRAASLHLDHCHERNLIRGILCVSCNQGLGQFRDDPGLLARAAAYLGRHGPGPRADSLPPR
jgi:hypothetical protein